MEVTMETVVVQEIIIALPKSMVAVPKNFALPLTTMGATPIGIIQEIIATIMGVIPIGIIQVADP
jgi:hypothetical protein